MKTPERMKPEDEPSRELVYISHGSRHWARRLRCPRQALSFLSSAAKVG